MSRIWESGTIGRARMFYSRNKDLALCGSLLAIFLVASLPFFGRWPDPWMDEAWFSDVALNFIRSGHFAMTMFSKHLPYGHFFVFMPPAHTLFLAAAYRLFGFGVIQGRAVSLVMALVALGSVYCVVRSHSTSRAAAVAILTLGAAASFFLAARQIRMEITVIAMFWLSWALLQRGHYLLSGLPAAVLALAHPNGEVFVALLLVVAAVRFASDRRAALFLVGFVPPVASWTAVLLFHWSYVRAELLDPLRQGMQQRGWAAMLRSEWSRYRQMVGLPLYAAGILGNLVFPTAFGLTILGMLAFVFLAYARLTTDKLPLYAPEALPFACILLGLTVDRLSRLPRVWGRLGSVAAASLLLVLGTLNLHADYEGIAYSRARDTLAVDRARILAAVPAGSSVIGSMPWWWTFAGTGRTFYAQATPAWLPSGLAADWALVSGLHPEYYLAVAEDEPCPCTEPIFRDLLSHSSLVEALPTAFDGPAYLFRINWSGMPAPAQAYAGSWAEAVTAAAK